VNLFLLFFEYFKIGLFSIGGGLATLPFIYRLAATYDWLAAADIPEMLAVAQLFPGGLGINLAAYIGLRAARLAGALVAPLGLITPPLIIIIVIARLYDAFKKNTVVRNVFDGLKPAAAGLLASVAWGLLRLSLLSVEYQRWYEILRIKECAIFVVLYILMLKLKKFPTAIFVVLGAAAGIVFRL
jgi:chromate transporter